MFNHADNTKTKKQIHQHNKKHCKNRRIPPHAHALAVSVISHLRVSGKPYFVNLYRALSQANTHELTKNALRFLHPTERAAMGNSYKKRHIPILLSTFLFFAIFAQQVSNISNTLNWNLSTDFSVFCQHFQPEVEFWLYSRKS